MKKLIFILLFITLNLFALSNEVKEAFAIGVFHSNGEGENVQHKKITNGDYNGDCFSKIAVLGKIDNKDIQVRIGDSVGYFVNSIPIFNFQNIKIGTEITFQHYNVSKGYFEVKIDGRILDSKVFVK
jgi:hypothetical protein